MEKFLMILMVCSVMTSLTTEAIKKLLDEKGKKYSSNILATILSIIYAVGISVAYLILTETAFTPQIAVYIVALIILSFLCATLGYDKVVQTISQLHNTR